MKTKDRKQSTINAQPFEKVLVYIDKNLDKKLTLDMLCKIESLSKFHFHRLFHLHFGLTVFQYIQLQRMKKAATQLYYHSHLSVTNIAFDAGFKNAESFSRAFKKIFLVTPTEFKKEPNWEPINNKLNNNLKNILKEEQTLNSQLNVNVIWFNHTKIAVMKHKGSTAKLPSSIKQFIEWRKENHTPPSISKTYNILYDDPSSTPADDYRFDIATNIKTNILDNSYGVIECEIPEGYCATLRHKGSDEHLEALINRLYSQWLPNSNHQLRDFPCFIERVTMFSTVNESEAITDIYLPIENFCKNSNT